MYALPINHNQNMQVKKLYKQSELIKKSISPNYLTIQNRNRNKKHIQY